MSQTTPTTFEQTIERHIDSLRPHPDQPRAPINEKDIEIEGGGVNLWC